MDNIFVRFIIKIMLISWSTKSMRDCPEQIELIPKGNNSKDVKREDCEKQLRDSAAKRNFFYIRPFESSDPLNLECNLCDLNSGEKPDWFYIRRNGAPIVGYSHNITEGNYLILLQTGTMIKDSPTYCLTTKNSLRIMSFDPDKVLGTYYCQYSSIDLYKYIWHHLDTFYSVDDPNHSKMVSRVQATSNSKVRIELNNIEDELKRAYPYLIHESNLVKIFYDFQNRPSTKGLCGDLKLKYFRRCYIEIPKNISDSRPLTTDEFANFYTILEGVKFLIEYQALSEKTDGRMFTALKLKANEMADSFGFSLKENVDGIVFPCHFSFLKHLEGIPKLGNPFGRANPYGEVGTQVNCPEINPMDIIKLAMARDIGQLKMKILGEVQKSMRSVDKLYLQGSVNEILICGFSKAGGDICSNRRSDVQWRKRDFVFTIQSIVKQRVYVQHDCRLFFTEITLKDRGSYHCHRKSADKKSWNFSPTTKFIIQVERSKNPLPSMSEVMKYLTILILWTGFIFIIWIVLSITNIRIKVDARFRAEERKMLLRTQDRRRNMELSAQNESELNKYEEGSSENEILKKID